MEYTPTIGLEIHAELRTKTKMFCSSQNNPDETKPNVNVCPVCLAHPGTLPVINREAVKHVLKVGIALGGRLADYTEFDRKNYFYPDLPKGYQLSQYEFPLVSGGMLKGVEITRVHLEEDTASSIHNEESGTTVIDYNRAGVPLMELVTEPVIKSAQEAGAFARELQLLLRTLNVSNANMEKGEMRVEANISMGKDGEMGVKVEIKNLNSFRVMEKAVAYEIDRQKKLLEKGEKVVQETRGWDEGKQTTFAQRTKEGSADYRYFPDPDLPSLMLSRVDDFAAMTLSKELPELPWQRRARYTSLGLKDEDAEILGADPLLARFFDEVIASAPSSVTPQAAANYITNDLMKILRDKMERDTQHSAEIPISAQYFNKILGMAGERKISSRVAKDLLGICVQSGKDPEVVVKEEGLLQVQDSDMLGDAVRSIIEGNPKVVEDLKKGKAAALEYLVGQGMRATRGAANPETLRELIQRSISS